MPSLGAGMESGRLLEWYVHPGDHVRRGDLIALVETDKANIEVEVFQDGVVEELLVEEGEKVPVGTVLARLGSGVAAAEDTAAEAPEQVPEPSPAEPSPAEPASPEPPPAEAPPAEPASPDGEVVDARIVSPLVRRLVEQSGVDVSQLRGTGPGGVITRHDVEEAVGRAATAAPAHADGAEEGGGEQAATPVTPPGHHDDAIPSRSGRSSPYARRLAHERGVDPATLTGSGPEGAVLARDVTAARKAPEPDASTPELAGPPSRPEPRFTPAAERADVMRRAIARAMEQANRDIPHYHLGETVDVEETLRWLSETNAGRPPARRLLPAVLVLKATALALKDHRDLNGYWIDGTFRAGAGIHLGVAISLRQGGLLAPAIRDVDDRSLDDLMEALKDLVERTRSGGLRGSELTDPTFTVSNLGDSGVESIHGLITPPQVAFLGVGRITPRPWAVDGMLAVRRTVYLGLAGDHRASDGRRGAHFLGAIATRLTRPETL